MAGRSRRRRRAGSPQRPNSTTGAGTASPRRVRPGRRFKRRLKALPRRLFRLARRRPGAFAAGVLAVALLALALLWPSEREWPRRMLVTAYCPCKVCCGPNAAGITASGRPVSANAGRFVAADRAVPFGTMLVIPGYNAGRPVEVLDRGGAIRGDHLDVFFATHDEALRWGKQWLEVDLAAPSRQALNTPPSPR